MTGASIGDTQPVKWSLLLANAIMLILMLTAVSHTGVSRFGRVRTGQSCLLHHITPRNNHHDKIYEKNHRLDKKLRVTCVRTEYDWDMRKKSAQRLLPAAPEMSRLPPSWSLRNVAAGALSSRSLTPYTETETTPICIHFPRHFLSGFIYQYSLQHFINCFFMNDTIHSS